jgi:putative intracellular protease/amidase
MTQKVLIVGFPGVQALDLVGPFDVFVGASAALAAQGKEGYQPVLASLDGQPVATGTGLTFGTATLPSPPERVDTLLLPGGQGTRPD